MKFYLDEDSAQNRLILALRSHAIDVLASFDAGMNGRDDESHLVLAAAQGRVLISANARDFASLHNKWLKEGQPHCGILIIPQQRYATGEIVRRLLRLILSGRDLSCRLYYLSSF